MPEFISMGEAISKLIEAQLPTFTFEIRESNAVLIEKNKEQGTAEYIIYQGKTAEEVNAFATGFMKGMIIFFELKKAK
jgi:NCAIR mutase (PurE)-related protein